MLEDEQRQISCLIGEKGERKAENEHINQKQSRKTVPTKEVRDSRPASWKMALTAEQKQKVNKEHLG